MRTQIKQSWPVYSFVGSLLVYLSCCMAWAQEGRIELSRVEYDDAHLVRENVDGCVRRDALQACQCDLKYYEALSFIKNASVALRVHCEGESVLSETEGSIDARTRAEGRGDVPPPPVMARSGSVYRVHELQILDQNLRDAEFRIVQALTEGLSAEGCRELKALANPMSLPASESATGSHSASATLLSDCLPATHQLATTIRIKPAN